MNNIALFGGSGQVGKCVMNTAIKRGIKIRALIRTMVKIEGYEDKIDIVKGNVLKMEDVRKTLEGQDAVIVVLGTGFDLGPTTVLSDGLKNILTGMREMKISVVSVCLSAFLFREPEAVPPQFREINADHQRMLDLLKDSTDLQWIAVFPPHIALLPRTGYFTAYDEAPGLKIVSKHDLGDFFVDSISMPEHYHKIVGIASNIDAN